MAGIAAADIVRASVNHAAVVKRDRDFIAGSPHLLT
jgi:hypothetical protein